MLKCCNSRNVVPKRRLTAKVPVDQWNRVDSEMVAGDVHTRIRWRSGAKTGRLPCWLRRAQMRWSIWVDSLRLTVCLFCTQPAPAWRNHEEQPTSSHWGALDLGPMAQLPTVRLSWFWSGKSHRALARRGWAPNMPQEAQPRLPVYHRDPHSGADQDSEPKVTKVSWEPQWIRSVRVSEEMALRFCTCCRTAGAAWGPHDVSLQQPAAGVRLLCLSWQHHHRQTTHRHHHLGIVYI